MYCRVCATKKSSFVMNNRFVCLDCDELLFDIEIESDAEMHTQSNSERTTPSEPTVPCKVIPLRGTEPRVFRSETVQAGSESEDESSEEEGEPDPEPTPIALPVRKKAA